MIFLFPITVAEWAMAPHSFPFFMRRVLGCLSPNKAVGAWKCHSSPTFLEFKNACSLTYTSQYIVVMLCPIRVEQLFLRPFGMRSVIVGFVVDGLARGQGFFFSPYFGFPLSVSFHQRSMPIYVSPTLFNPLNAKLNPIYHLLALLGAHHIFHVSRLRVNITI